MAKVKKKSASKDGINNQKVKKIPHVERTKINKKKHTTRSSSQNHAASKPSPGTKGQRKKSKKGNQTDPQKAQPLPAKPRKRNPTTPQNDTKKRHSKGGGDACVQKMQRLDESYDQHAPEDEPTIEYAVRIRQRIIRCASGSTYMLLYPGEKLCVRGRALIASIRGILCVNGYNIKAGQPAMPIYSPSQYSLLTIEAIPSGDNSESIEVYLNRLDCVENEKSGIEKTCQVMGDNVNVIIAMVQKLESPIVDYVTQVTPFLHMFDADGRNNNVVATEGLTVNNEYFDRALKIPASFTRAADDALQYRPAVVAVCGGKNSGKSTLARYVVNRLLNVEEKVAWLECDVGQTETTPSCCVSLTLISEPMLGPPFTHQKKPELSKYLGVASPADDATAYMGIVEQVFAHYKRHLSHVPLVINTMGWNKGIGLALLVDTLKLTRPKVVLQIDVENEKRNLPNMYPDFVGDVGGWVSGYITEPDQQLNYQLVKLRANSGQKPDMYKLTPTDYRNLSLLAYFSPLNNGNAPVPCPFQSARPYKVPWSAVAVHACGPAVPMEQIMYALNCSCVALCRVEEHLMEKPVVEGYPKYFHGDPENECLGFGVIRGIDPEAKVFFVVTPMTRKELRRVNTLIRGANVLSQELIDTQIRSNGVLPYMGYLLDSVGSTAIKERKHKPRHPGTPS